MDLRLDRIVRLRATLPPPCAARRSPTCPTQLVDLYMCNYYNRDGVADIWFDLQAALRFCSADASRSAATAETGSCVHSFFVRSIPLIDLTMCREASSMLPRSPSRLSLHSARSVFCTSLALSFG